MKHRLTILTPEIAFKTKGILLSIKFNTFILFYKSKRISGGTLTCFKLSILGFGIQYYHNWYLAGEEPVRGD